MFFAYFGNNGILNCRMCLRRIYLMCVFHRSRPNRKGRLKTEKSVFRRSLFGSNFLDLSGVDFVFAAQQGNQVADALFHIAAVDDLVNSAFFRREIGRASCRERV